MTQVTVDAENLWFILQQYKCRLNMSCPKNKDLETYQKLGFYFQEYEIIKQMEQQIREVI